MNNFLSHEAFSVLRIRNFRFYLYYRFFMTTAALMQSVVVGWQLYKLTNNVLALGMIGLTEVIPQVSIALFAGHYTDLWDRKKIIMYTTFLLLLGSGILMVYSIPSLNCYQLFGTFPIFITIFITGFVRGILVPAHTALLGQLVPREKLTSAATWSSTNWHIAAVTGPAIGGLIYGFSSDVVAYAAVFGFFFVSLMVMISIKSPKWEAVVATGEGIFERIHEGIRYVFDNKVLLGAFSLDMFAVLFGGAVALLPVFAKDILGAGPQGLGILRACPAFGAILMSAILTFRPPVHKTGTYLFIGVSGFGLCMIAFALSHNFYFSAFVLFLSGAFDNVSVVIRSSILQLFTPNEMRGRVAAVNSIFVGSSNELGAFESGVAARIMGLVPSVIFGGTMTLLVVAVAARSVPQLRTLSLRKVVKI
jgi:MFS family permease